ncbi:MAG: hypothetical protein AABY15_08615 [Nanoarchaeota archaeon]
MRLNKDRKNYTKLNIIGASLIILLILFAWSPWITKNYSQTLVLEKFNQRWYGIDDGCGSFNQTTSRIEPDLITLQKTLFGYKGYIEYYCGMLNINSKPEQDNIFISPLGTIYGL